MTEKKALESFKKINNEWLTSLNNYSEEELKKTDSEKKWTLGQVYAHLFMINELVIKNIILLIDGKGVTSSKNRHFFVKLIFLLNSLPPLKFKIPSVVNPPFQPESKREIVQKFKAVEEKMSEIIPKAFQVDTDQKLKHPRFGYINAREWVAFINIHMKHHIRQKRKLDRKLKER